MYKLCYRFFVVALAAVLLAACGDSDESSNPADSKSLQVVSGNGEIIVEELELTLREYAIDLK